MFRAANVITIISYRALTGYAPTIGRLVGIPVRAQNYAGRCRRIERRETGLSA